MGIFVKCGVGLICWPLSQAASRQAMDVAVRTLIEWTSDDPDREGCAARRSETCVWGALRRLSHRSHSGAPARCEEPNKYDGPVVLGPISTQSAQSPKL